MSLKLSTLALYDRALKKIGVESIIDLQNHDAIIDRINNLSSNSYKLMAYRAIHNMLDDKIYEKEYRKLHNSIYNDNIGSLPMTLPELLSIEVKCKEPLQQLVEGFTIWLNTHYPLRLDYFNVEINPVEKENCVNYMTYSDSILTFYLNDFKNVRSFGSQVLTYSDTIICNYINSLTEHFARTASDCKAINGEAPKYLLYRYDTPTKTLQPFSSRIMYGGYLQDILRKHTGKEISMNTIRKIHESDFIQSKKYVTLTNVEKKIKHNKLLHSMATALECYNIIDSNVVNG